MSANDPIAVAHLMRFTPSMHVARPPVLSMVAVVLMLCGCHQPSSDQEQLEAVRAEAAALMRSTRLASGEGRQIAKEDWPKAIASLQPETVAVEEWGVSILKKSDMDGGWGYDLPRSKADLPMPDTCYSQPSPGVYWHRPC
jgi:hypothetical protein